MGSCTSYGHLLSPRTSYTTRQTNNVGFVCWARPQSVSLDCYWWEPETCQGFDLTWQSSQDRAQQVYMLRLNEAQAVSRRLYSTWKPRQQQCCILLCGSECWPITKKVFTEYGTSSIQTSVQRLNCTEELLQKHLSTSDCSRSTFVRTDADEQEHLSLHSNLI